MPEEQIPNIIGKLEREDIQIPELQREFVWKAYQIKTLADSIYKGYPIGMLTFYPPPRELGGKEGVYWVLDGQQRLFSLWLIVKGEITLRGSEKKKLWVWFNSENEEFACKETGTPLGDKWIEILCLFKIKTRRDLEKYLASRNQPAEEKERISTLWNTLRNYTIPYRAVDSSANLDVLGDLFVRTNYAGTRVRGTDIFSTMIAVAERGTAEALRDIIKGLPGRWSELDYGVAVKTFVTFLTDGKVKLASRVLDQATKLKEKLREKKKESKIPEMVKVTKRSIQEAINLLEQRWLKIYSPGYKLLPYGSSLVTLSFYIGKKEKLSPIEEEGILIWYVLASYFGRYGKSADTRLNEDLLVIAQGGGYKKLIEKLREREGDVEEAIKRDISRGDYTKLLLYALLRKNESCDFISGNILDSRDVSIHHIFPSGLVEERGEDIGNLTLTTLGTNNQLRAHEPSNYLPNVSEKIRKQHLLPETRSLWKVQKYDGFLQERKELLKQLVSKFFQSYKI